MNGWNVDQWILSTADVDAVITGYRGILLVDSIDSRIRRDLASDGINLDNLLQGEDAWSDRTPAQIEQLEKNIRADLTELAAAASLIAKEGVRFEQMTMPNIPKGSFTVSEHGIDVLAFTYSVTTNDIDLLPDERIYLCSVKHSITDASDLRYKLVESLKGTSLNRSYLASQFRLLHGRLDLLGIRCDRIYKILTTEIASRHLIYMAVAGIDSNLASDLQDQMQNLPVKTDRRHFRQLLIPDIANLHAQIRL